VSDGGVRAGFRSVAGGLAHGQSVRGKKPGGGSGTIGDMRLTPYSTVVPSFSNGFLNSTTRRHGGDALLLPAAAGPRATPPWPEPSTAMLHKKSPIYMAKHGYGVLSINWRFWALPRR
jgi:hypothetical protein